VKHAAFDLQVALPLRDALQSLVVVSDGFSAFTVISFRVLIAAENGARLLNLSIEVMFASGTGNLLGVAHVDFFWASLVNDSWDPLVQEADKAAVEVKEAVKLPVFA